jgi:hypothetical protein
MSFGHLLASNNVDSLQELVCNSCAFYSPPFSLQSVTGSYLPTNLVNAVCCASGPGTTLFVPSSTGLANYLAATGLSRFATSNSASGSSFTFDLINAGAALSIGNNADANWSLVSAQASTPFTFPYIVAANTSRKCVVTKTGPSLFQLAVV